MLLGITSNSEFEGHEQVWKIKPLFFVLVFYLFSSIALGLVLKKINYEPDALFLQTADSVIFGIAIIFLNSEYPSIKKKLTKVTCKYVLAGILLIVLFNFPYGILLGNVSELSEEFTSFFTYNSFGKILYLFLLIAISPLLQEIFFRGFLYRVLKKKIRSALGRFYFNSYFRSISSYLCNLCCSSWRCVYLCLRNDTFSSCKCFYTRVLQCFLVHFYFYAGIKMRLELINS